MEHIYNGKILYYAAARRQFNFLLHISNHCCPLSRLSPCSISHMPILFSVWNFAILKVSRALRRKGSLALTSSIGSITRSRWASCPGSLKWRPTDFTVSLRVVDCCPQMSCHPVCEAARFPLTTNAYIGWCQPSTWARVLLAHHQVDSCTLACDMLSYPSSGSREWAGVGGGVIAVQAEGTV